MDHPVPYHGPHHVGYRMPVADRVNLLALLRRSLRMFRNRWWIPLLTLALGSGLATYYSFTTPDTYRAQSRLGIAPRIALSQRSGDRAVVLEEKNSFVADQLQYMRGSQVLGRVEEKMQEFRLPDGPPPSRHLTVSQGQGSTFIMTVESSNLEYARQFARTWAQEFLAFKEQMHSEVARRQMDKTRVELSQQEEQVAEAQHRLDDFIREHRIATSQDTGNAAQDLLINLQRRRQAVMLEGQRLEERSAAELADLPDAAFSAAPLSPTPTSPTGPPPPNPEDPVSLDSADPLDKFTGRSSYRDLRLALARLLAESDRQSEVLKPRHPYMVRLQEAIGETRRQIATQLDLIEELRQARIGSLRQEEAVLDRQVESQRTEVERLREIHRQFVSLGIDLAAKRELRDQFARELQALHQIQPSSEIITILEEGLASDQPVGPARARIIVTGILVGLLSGFGLVFLLHRLDDRLESAEDLEHALDEPILGQVPLLSLDNRPPGSFVSVDDLQVDTLFVESFRGVRSSIMFGDLGGPRQVLLATSSVPGDGKSTFTVNFAITLARAGNRVLLIDADLRRGTVAQVFGVPSEPGLSEVLDGREPWSEVLNATPHRSLAIITAGGAAPNPGERLLSRSLHQLVSEARTHFDYIIFDSPPVIGMDDVPTLASQCDGLIFVYRAGVTSLRLARLAVNTVRQRGARILGLILNGVSTSDPGYYYTAYYYAQYHNPIPSTSPADAPPDPAPPAHRPAGASLLATLRSDGNGQPNPPPTVDVDPVPSQPAPTRRQPRNPPS
ncbi:MAG: polysaccharide biosynthesis tyrosine autokinase [Verrucomicrobiae bacterium]|nr:polysaccharide biosynthesis tyrosine autokinase [Verrucomicrobiae bacterium]